jgi:hypothetical protein
VNADRLSKATHYYGPLTSDPHDPFGGLEPQTTSERIALSYLRWGVRHRNVVTLLSLGTTVLLFVVFWQLFGLTVGIIAVVVTVLVMAGYWLSLRHSR